MQKTLRVIPEPKPNTRSVMIQNEGEVPFVFMKGGGSEDLICGSCDALLCESVAWANLRGVVFKCPMCGTFNDSE